MVSAGSSVGKLLYWMNLLIVFPGPLYPITGMSQIRVVNQIKRLSEDHEITFIDLISGDKHIEECCRRLGTFVKAYHPVFFAAFRQTKLIRALKYLIFRLRWLFSSYSIEELTLSTGFIRRQLGKITTENAFDAIMIHYWYLGYLFTEIDEIRYKMIDTHYLVEENAELLPKYKLSGLLRWRMKRELQHCLKLQHLYFGLSDLIIVNSARQKDILDAKTPNLKVELTVNGQDLEDYLDYNTPVEQHSVLYYGALSNQFNRLGLVRLLKEIYPLLKKSIPGVKIYVVGSKPPMDLINQYKDDNVIVTGFVEDIRPVIARCCLMILPLETSSGFRGRAVEVMSLGVPVVGTGNALQSLEIENGIEGFIAEKPDEIAEQALKILHDMKLRQIMSEACRTFASENFSIEATFGKLSEGLTKMGKAAHTDE